MPGLLAHTPKVTTAIVWIKDTAPAEVHTNELEKFLIVEGSCEIIIEEDIHQLFPGDFWQFRFLKVIWLKLHQIFVAK
ncbi:MAG: hypothetical protein WKG06_28365 [Segetibacter sp.]